MVSRDEFKSAMAEALGPLKAQVDGANENAGEARRMLAVLLAAPGAVKGEHEHSLSEAPIGIRPYRDQPQHTSDLNTVLGEMLELTRHIRDKVDEK